MTRIGSNIALGIIALAPIVVFAQQKTDPPGPSVGQSTPNKAAGGSRTRDALTLKDLVGETNFKSAGLEKLVPNEAQVLEEWVIAYGIAQYQVGATDYAPIESRIDGEFEGWEGDTVVKLMNGQVWQQTSFDYEYSYEYCPDVLVYRSGLVYKMRVEGLDDVVSVVRLK